MSCGMSKSTSTWSGLLVTAVTVPISTPSSRTLLPLYNPDPSRKFAQSARVSSRNGI
ncbi:Uncharacterised protein [Mycobacteroides abscessus subsp. abscessus]|nr:Uncharacterised protein [Mycobacteroides abscessus subsp. abscessus]